jgi:bacterial/archaeal transporter family protein
MWIFYAILGSLFAALVTILAKLGLKNIDSTLATTIRSSIMFLSLCLFSLFSHKFSPNNFTSITSSDWWLIILSGLAGAASWLFYFAALKFGPTIPVTIIDKGSLILIAIFSIFILKDAFTIKTILGVILMFTGILLTVIK